MKSDPATISTDPPCELCGNQTVRLLLRGVVDYLSGETFDIIGCDRCGLAMTHPRPAEQALAGYYPPRYRTDRQKLTGTRRVKRRAGAVEKHFPPGFRGRLLDLGCGTGAFAREMRRRGWDVAVTELNDQVLNELRAQGIDARRPDEALRAGFAAPFDAITAWHVLEHVPNPAALMAFARDNLAPGGIVQATVPNFASWQARRYGRHWLHLDVPRHLYHFTPETLGRLITQSGLRIERQTTVAIEYDLFGVMQSALNRVCTQPNVLFEMITGGAAAAFPPRDVALSWMAAPLLGPFALAHCLLAGATSNGATLTITCRPA
jgi:SAM-dependent methyltransferase